MLRTDLCNNNTPGLPFNDAVIVESVVSSTHLIHSTKILPPSVTILYFAPLVNYFYSFNELLKDGLNFEKQLFVKRIMYPAKKKQSIVLIE